MRESGWIAVALSRDVEPGAVTGVIIQDEEWALWRAKSGHAHFWEDRCPHRGMRLSFGFVRGDRLGCLYHGWQYGESGQCCYVPAHPELDVPATIRVATYPVAESGGMIWTCFAPSPPAPPAFGDAVPVRSLFLDASLPQAVEVLESFGVEPFPAGPAGHAAPAPERERVWIAPIGADRLLMAGQDVGATRSALHIAILGAAARYAGPGQAHFSQWAERLRHAIETSASAQARDAA